MAGGTQQPTRDRFGSKFGIIAAAAGSAVGLGNIWRFPYETGSNGGGAFLIVYLGFVLLVGVLVMIAEMTIGRAGQRNAVGSFKALSPGKPWFLIGVMGVGAAFMIFAYYGAVAGWTLEYLFQALKNGFANKSSDQLESQFNNFVQGSYRPILWQTIFILLTAAVVVAGVKKGIEKYSKILMPIFIVIILVSDWR